MHYKKMSDFFILYHKNPLTGTNDANCVINSKKFLKKLENRSEFLTMSVEKVREYLTPYGVADRMREFEVSSATVELAALAVGVEGARIAKTLSFKVGEDPILIVAAGDAKVDNSKYKHFFGAKAKMLTAEEAVERIGHAVGGVCPFANPEGVETYLDVSLQRFDTVFPAAGSSNSAIELTCDELAEYSHSKGWIDVCKAWQENS